MIQADLIVPGHLSRYLAPDTKLNIVETQSDALSGSLSLSASLADGSCGREHVAPAFDTPRIVAGRDGRKGVGLVEQAERRHAVRFGAHLRQRRWSRALSRRVRSQQASSCTCSRSRLPARHVLYVAGCVPAELATPSGTGWVKLNRARGDR